MIALVMRGCRTQRRFFFLFFSDYCLNRASDLPLWATLEDILTVGRTKFNYDRCDREKPKGDTGAQILGRSCQHPDEHVDYWCLCRSAAVRTQTRIFLEARPRKPNTPYM